ncbi:MAG: TonB family protein [Sandaracinaceae bacterium]
MLSLGAHAFVALVLMRLPSAPRTPMVDAADAPYEVDMVPEGMSDGVLGAPARGAQPSSADPLEAGGHASAQNLDSRERGQGGDARGAAQAILLMDRAQDILLLDSPLNNLAAAQTQRIRTARSRATLEHRRATPNPADDVFLASGHGEHPERRPVAATDATAGARVAPIASVEGATPSTAHPGASGHGPTASSALGGSALHVGGGVSASTADRGTSAPSPGRGILEGQGAQHREAADVAMGRPSVDRGPAATQTSERDSQVRDDTDAELLAGQMMQSWVESTAHSGREEGPGRGGVGGGGSAGVGGSRAEGGRASAYGPGDGSFDALDTSDARYRRWFLESRRRVEDALRFPRERALAMDQGTSIYAITVRRDGTLVGAPRLVRTSGFDDIDAAALAAIRAATPFSPLPDDLAPELSRLSLRLPIELSNPMVR